MKFDELDGFENRQTPEKQTNTEIDAPFMEKKPSNGHREEETPRKSFRPQRCSNSPEKGISSPSPAHLASQNAVAKKEEKAVPRKPLNSSNMTLQELLKLPREEFENFLMEFLDKKDKSIPKIPILGISFSK